MLSFVVWGCLLYHLRRLWVWLLVVKGVNWYWRSYLLWCLCCCSYQHLSVLASVTEMLIVLDIDCMLCSPAGLCWFAALWCLLWFNRCCFMFPTEYMHRNLAVWWPSVNDVFNAYQVVDGRFIVVFCHCRGCIAPWPCFSALCWHAVPDAYDVFMVMWWL